jgi:hypothetical protein
MSEPAVEFVAIAKPGPALLAEMAALSPTNPFATAAYVASRQGFGGEPWVIGVREDGRLSTACLAYMYSGHLTRSFDVISLPELLHPESFWNELVAFCRKHDVEELHIHSYGSLTAEIPALAGERSRTDRCEYVLDLRSDDLAAGLSGDHRRNIARARKNGLTIRRARDGKACEAHTAMILASMERRQHRGESVPVDAPHEEFLATTASGAGELFQAIHDGAVVSSVMLLRAARGAYSQTMGTSPLGMKMGGSRLVIFEAARMLKDEGLEILNLGGVSEENPGLREFKLGFGTRAIHLQAAEFSFATSLKRSVLGAARALRSVLGTH